MISSIVTFLKESYQELAHQDQQDMAEFSKWRSRAIQSILVAASILAIPLLALSFSRATDGLASKIILGVYSLMFLGSILLAFNKQWSSKFRGNVFCSILYLVGIASLLRSGQTGIGQEYLMIPPLVAVILISVQSGIVFLGISSFILLFFPWMATSGLLDAFLGSHTDWGSLSNWLIQNTITLILILFLFVLLLRFYRLFLQGLSEMAEKNSITERNNQKSQIMIEGIGSHVKDLCQELSHLDLASSEININAVEVRDDLTHISGTLQQVALGISQQTDSITSTASAVEKVIQAVDTVSSGTLEQQKAVEDASVIAVELVKIFQNIANNAKNVQGEAKAAANTAQTGTLTVEETIQSMQSIKHKTDQTAEIVASMGKQSERVNDILKTISDIASQTNLLALNAAIEAARAGIHGKGFAVVADEVRKLADRSAQAAQEISTIIHAIQTTITDAVTSMQESSQEVEAGFSRANLSGKALFEILESVESVYDHAGNTVRAAETNLVTSNQLVSAMDAVSEVVERNIASSLSMKDNTNTMTQSIESIASVSEQNNAAMEEISSATQEIHQNLVTVTQSVQQLPQLTQHLTRISQQINQLLEMG